METKAGWQFHIMEVAEMGTLRKKTRFILTMAVFAVCGCVSTTGVVVPVCVNSNSSFQAVVTVVVEDDGGAWGGLGALVPNGWSANGASYLGPYGTGNMSPEMGGLAKYIEGQYPSNPWAHWLGFSSDVQVQGESGDVYEVTVTICTDDIVGSVEIGFLGCVQHDGQWYWNNPPFYVTVEVEEEYSLCLETWGAIKAGR